jgi:hypothetical protein
MRGRFLNLESCLLLFLAGCVCLPVQAQNKLPNSPAPNWVQPAVDAPRLQHRTFASTSAKSPVSYHLYTPEA